MLVKHIPPFTNLLSVTTQYVTLLEEQNIVEIFVFFWIENSGWKRNAVSGINVIRRAQIFYKTLCRSCACVHLQVNESWSVWKNQPITWSGGRWSTGVITWLCRWSLKIHAHNFRTSGRGGASYAILICYLVWEIKWSIITKMTNIWRKNRLWILLL